MTAPLDPRKTWWEDEGGRTAERLREVSAVLVVGANPEEAARVAVGIARAESERRHVALGDLVGDLAPLYAIAGGEDAFGLADCLRHGLPLNDIARPAPDRESLFILPAGSPPVSTAETIAHERWPRLVNGFAKAGALLILVVPIDAPGIETLAGATGGAVLVNTPLSEAKNIRVLATLSGPDSEAAQPAGTGGARPWRSLAVVAVLAVVAALGIGAWLAWRRRAPAQHAFLAAGAQKQAAGSAPVPPSVAPPPADTVRLADPVNPADTTSTVPFAVEVMAANTFAGANSFLTSNGESAALSGATVSPVVVGASTSVWYKVVAGASHDRGGADSLLAAARRDGAVRSGDGRVVKVPYALVLAGSVDQTEVAGLVRSWRQRGVDAYALVQNDGSVRLLAGAFETPAQAAPLASALRAAGVVPVLVFRTGRAY